MARNDERARERQRGRHAERIARGTCSRCGRTPPEPGLKVCRGCAEKRRAAERARRARARKNGMPYAGRDPELCRRADRAGDRRRRKERRDAGLCTSCGHCPPADGRSFCEPCREARRTLDRRRYDARRADALCVRCARPTFAGSSRCGRCSVLERERTSPERRSAADKKRYARRKAQRVCVDCSTPTAGTARCPSCARRSNVRTPDPLNAPAPFPEYAVVEVATGDVLGIFETEAEAAACLVFEGLRPDQVEIHANVPLMALVPP